MGSTIGTRSGARGSYRRSNALLPLLLFVAYLVIGNFILIHPLIHEHLVSPWTHCNAVATATMIRIFGGNAKVLGTAISSGSATLDVRNGCNGVHALLMLASAILATPVL